MAQFVFGEWLPDQPATLNQGLLQADGCFPIANGYAPIKSFIASPNGALTSACTGGTSYRVSGVTYTFIADSNNLWSFSTSGYTNLASGLNNGLGIRFAPYSTLMLATNGVDPIKKYTPAPTNTLTNLGGSPPTARYIAVVGGFTVLGYVSGLSLRVAWSNQGNPEQWTPSSSSEAGVLDLAGGGDITGIVGGQVGLVLQENTVTRMTYTGDSRVWQFDRIATDLGCILPGSVATWGQLTFFLSTRGFMRCDGSSVTPIGAEKVDRWFAQRGTRAYYDGVSAIIDPRNTLYIVTLPNSTPANTVLIYNYTLERWSTAQMLVERLLPGLASPGSPDNTPGSPDNTPGTPDGLAYRGGDPLLLMFNDKHQMGTLTGLPLPATFQDSAREPGEGRRTRITAVRPLTDAATPTIAITGQDNLSTMPVTSTYSVSRLSGRVRVRESWNTYSIMVQIPSQPWTFAQGYAIDSDVAGRV